MYPAEPQVMGEFEFAARSGQGRDSRQAVRELSAVRADNFSSPTGSSGGNGMRATCRILQPHERRHESHGIADLAGDLAVV